MAALTLAAVEDSDTAAIAASSATLTDAAWAEICAAAKHASDAEARVVLSAILFNDYPGFTYDRARVAAAAKRARRMLKNFAAFEADYRAQFAPADNAILDDPPPPGSNRTSGALKGYGGERRPCCSSPARCSVLTPDAGTCNAKCCIIGCAQCGSTISMQS